MQGLLAGPHSHVTDAVPVAEHDALVIFWHLEAGELRANPSAVGGRLRRPVVAQGRPRPWNANWVPTAVRLDEYAVAVGMAQGAWTAAPLSVKVGMNR